MWKNDQVSEEETAEILRLAEEALSIEGDFVEFGCYKGDTSLLLAEILQRDAMLCQKMRYFGTRQSIPRSLLSSRAGTSLECGDEDVEKSVENSAKKLWIYDSFEGLPEKSEFDESVLGENFRGGELIATKREVKERFLRAGLPVPVIKKGWFSELTSEDLPSRIAFSFLDGDFYESIRDSLRLVMPRMAKGGVIIVHDYTNLALPGVRRAVEEWREWHEGVKVVLL